MERNSATTPLNIDEARRGGAMWKWTLRDENKPDESFNPEVTHIGKSIVIKGEVSGSENVSVAGELRSPLGSGKPEKDALQRTQKCFPSGFPISAL
jgi:hypothetical protein